MLEIPNYFFDVKYNCDAVPGQAFGLENGANCQHYCYEILRFFGFKIADLRSSELFEDTSFTEHVEQIEPFDLVLFHRNETPYGAHVALCVGNDQFIHLARKEFLPKIWRLEDFLSKQEYQFIVGIKRPRFKK